MEKKIIEKFVKQLVDEFETGDGVVLKIYTFYKAYIKQLDNTSK
jgi:hypothetical protein